MDGEAPVKDGVDDDALDLDDLARALVSHESPPVACRDQSNQARFAADRPQLAAARRSPRGAGPERAFGAGAGCFVWCGSWRSRFWSVRKLSCGPARRRIRRRLLERGAHEGTEGGRRATATMASRLPTGSQMTGARSADRRSPAARAARRAQPPWSPPAGPRTSCSSRTLPGASRAARLRARRARRRPGAMPTGGHARSDHCAVRALRRPYPL